MECSGSSNRNFDLPFNNMVPACIIHRNKNIIYEKDMNWGKTAHGLIQHEHAIQRAKQKIKKQKDELKIYY